MLSVTVENNTIDYCSREEILQDRSLDLFGIYLTTYDIAAIICKYLSIPCPYISLCEKLRIPDSQGAMSIGGAKTFTPADVPELTKNLILMSVEDFEQYQFIGTLAHELRHIWQYTYEPDINLHPAVGFLESLRHPAEIDADGYAIRYLSDIYNMGIDKAAAIMCPEEKKHYKQEYQLRADKAKELSLCYDRPAASHTPKNNLMSRIKTLFKKVADKKN